MSISASIHGMDNLVHNLSKFSDEVVKGVVDVAQIFQAIISNDAKQNHPYTDRTENLTKSIQPGDVVITDTDVEAFVEARMQYASYVEFGTSRAKPYPYLVPAMLRQAQNFKNAIAREIKKINL